jgi:hypothetical protein
MLFFLKKKKITLYIVCMYDVAMHVNHHVNPSIKYCSRCMVKYYLNSDSSLFEPNFRRDFKEMLL